MAFSLALLTLLGVNYPPALSSDPVTQSRVSDHHRPLPGPAASGGRIQGGPFEIPMRCTTATHLKPLGYRVNPTVKRAARCDIPILCLGRGAWHALH